ncbi:hypothetical protein [Pelagicoccus mobilis]|uniref:Uncharacterized protein n=1 Tax=Pelagicoccus mobilis TaxID=415221 RepID=A0A934VP95_9BACT|nr:hypothetical protein [Pelagicoccus mobilis]MBK1875585.1 hypothetical protein [Pelagicoccus mobilis]
MNTNTAPDNRAQALQNIEAFEKAYDYDASYMKVMLDEAPEALEVFNHFVPMASHRAHAPLDVYMTAKLTAYRHADCGPCLQLAVRVAQQAGFEDELIAAIVLDQGQLPPHLLRVQAFTKACLEESETCEELRTELKWEHGKATMIELGLVIAAAQVFPIVKRSMGYHTACSLISIDV